MATRTPYIGCTISLLSKLGIRYEGVLYTVSGIEKTISLAKVRSFGTEDRPSAEPVPANEDVFEFVIFKAADIKDLVVCDGPKQRATLDGGLPQDPAIVSVSNKPVMDVSPRTAANTSASRTGAPINSQRRFLGPNLAFRQPFLPQGFHGPLYPNRMNGGGYGVNRSFDGVQNFPRAREIVGDRRLRSPPHRIKFESDYDFEAANKQFKGLTSDGKEQERKDKEDTGGAKGGSPNECAESKKEEENDPAAFYNRKVSFFDSISSELSEKVDGKNSRADRKKERETNEQTFGHSAVRSLAYQYRGAIQQQQQRNQAFRAYAMPFNRFSFVRQHPAYRYGMEQPYLGMGGGRLRGY